ncbi:MAG TPA: serine hydrolase domain-containing protein [Limnochordia bacterium]
MTAQAADPSRSELAGLARGPDPSAVGMDPGRLRRAAALVESLLIPAGGNVAAASLCVIRRGAIVLAETWGAPADVPFLAASLTKPVVGMAVLSVAQEGGLSLDEPAAAYLPAFGQKGKEPITVRQLLSHTSGLPDMVPENLTLRAAHQPLAAFYERLLAVSPLFEPGSAVSYQSMGFLVLAELLQILLGQPLSHILQERLFAPLGLRHTRLGIDGAGGGRDVSLTESELGVPVQLPDDQVGTDWNWNSPYWRRLGAPWGGLLTTAPEMAALAYAAGCGHGALFGLPLRRAMLEDVTAELWHYPGPPSQAPAHSSTARPVTDTGGRAHAWGLGWRLNRDARARRTHFGDFLSPAAFGHTGATGTAVWCDPEYDLACCLLTSQPRILESGVIARLANAVAGAVTA